MSYEPKEPPKVRVMTSEREFTAELSDDMSELYTEVGVGALCKDSTLVDHAKTFKIEPDDEEYCEPFYATTIGDAIAHFKTVTFNFLG